MDGPTAPDAKKDEDVYIADYKMNEKQRLAREAFAKRYAELLHQQLSCLPDVLSVRILCFMI